MDVDFVRKAVRAIGRCAIKVEVSLASLFIPKYLHLYDFILFFPIEMSDKPLLFWSFNIKIPKHKQPLLIFILLHIVFQ